MLVDLTLEVGPILRRESLKPRMVESFTLTNVAEHNLPTHIYLLNTYLETCVKILNKASIIIKQAKYLPRMSSAKQLKD